MAILIVTFVQYAAAVVRKGDGGEGKVLPRPTYGAAFRPAVVSEWALDLSASRVSVTTA